MNKFIIKRTTLLFFSFLILILSLLLFFLLPSSSSPSFIFDEKLSQTLLAAEKKQKDYLELYPNYRSPSPSPPPSSSSSPPSPPSSSSSSPPSSSPLPPPPSSLLLHFLSSLPSSPKQAYISLLYAPPAFHSSPYLLLRLSDLLIHFNFLPPSSLILSTLLPFFPSNLLLQSRHQEVLMKILKMEKRIADKQGELEQLEERELIMQFEGIIVPNDQTIQQEIGGKQEDWDLLRRNKELLGRLWSLQLAMDEIELPISTEDQEVLLSYINRSDSFENHNFTDSTSSSSSSPSSSPSPTSSSSSSSSSSPSYSPPHEHLNQLKSLLNKFLSKNETLEETQRNSINEHFMDNYLDNLEVFDYIYEIAMNSPPHSLRPDSPPPAGIIPPSSSSLHLLSLLPPLYHPPYSPPPSSSSSSPSSSPPPPTSSSSPSSSLPLPPSSYPPSHSLLLLLHSLLHNRSCIHSLNSLLLLIPPFEYKKFPNYKTRGKSYLVFADPQSTPLQIDYLFEEYHKLEAKLQKMEVMASKNEKKYENETLEITVDGVLMNMTSQREVKPTINLSSSFNTSSSSSLSSSASSSSFSSNSSSPTTSSSSSSASFNSTNSSSFLLTSYLLLNFLRIYPFSLGNERTIWTLVSLIQMNKGMMPLCGGRKRIWEETINGSRKMVKYWLDEEERRIKAILKKNEQNSKI